MRWEPGAARWEFEGSREVGRETCPATITARSAYVNTQTRLALKAQGKVEESSREQEAVVPRASDMKTLDLGSRPRSVALGCSLNPISIFI